MRYWIGLGANLGDRLATLRSAAAALADHGDILRRSRVYAASPVGGPPQPSFLNAALLLDSPLRPHALLGTLHSIEATLGRDRAREERWGPRTIDLDLLLAGDRAELVLMDDRLVIPHARLAERAFALTPLIDLDETVVHPMLLRSLRALLREAQLSKDAVADTGDLL